MNKFNIKLNSTCDFELLIESPITILTGDSGTGKTLLFRSLVGIVNNNLQKNVQGIKLEDIRICLNEREVGNILNQQFKFIFVDRYDSYSSEAKRDINRSMMKYRNNWIIVSRLMEVPNLGTSGHGVKEIKMKKQNGHISLYMVPYQV